MADSQQPFVSIVVPCFRSGAWLAELVERIDATMRSVGRTYEVLLVNDASPDSTWNAIVELAEKYPSVRGFDLLFNAGQFRATICGIERARGEMVLTIDDDLQHPPEEIPKLIEAFADSPQADCVIATFPQTRQTWFRRMGSRLAALVNQWMYGKPRDLKLTSFRLMTRATAEAICAHGTSRPVIGPLLLQCTSNIVNVPVNHHTRPHRASGYTIMRLVGTLVDNIISSSTFPLRAVSLLGILSATASGVLGLFYLVRYLLGAILLPGFATIVLLVVFFGGMTLFSIGILGEYVIRVIRESSRPPRYFVREEVAGSEVASVTPTSRVQPLEK